MITAASNLMRTKKPLRQERKKCIQNNAAQVHSYLLHANEHKFKGKRAWTIAKVKHKHGNGVIARICVTFASFESFICRLCAGPDIQRGTTYVKWKK